MKGTSCIIVLSLVCFFAVNAQNVTTHCEQGKYPPDPKTKVDWYTINLDLPPEKRWEQVGKDKGAQIQYLLDGFLNFLEEWGSAAKYIKELIDNDMGLLDKTLPYPFPAELRGMSEASGVNLGEIVLFNLFHEFFSACTSIVAEDPNGDLYHGRNLDFGLFLGWNVTLKDWIVTNRLRPLIINVNFTRNGQTVFKAVNFAGYTGILTAIKPKLFSMSMDQRFDFKEGGIIGVLKWIFGDHSHAWMGFLTRNVMENATSFAEATAKLNNTALIGPAYFIMGGNQSGEGAVITRTPDESLNFWSMKQADDWYILETNYDHWKKPMILDDRRTSAHKCMDKMTQKNTGIPGLFNVLSTQPNLNKLTTYTALMHVASGHLETYIQHCQNPCTPW